MARNSPVLHALATALYIDFFIFCWDDNKRMWKLHCVHATNRANNGKSVQAKQVWLCLKRAHYTLLLQCRGTNALPLIQRTAANSNVTTLTCIDAGPLLLGGGAKKNDADCYNEGITRHSPVLSGAPRVLPQGTTDFTCPKCKCALEYRRPTKPSVTTSTHPPAAYSTTLHPQKHSCPVRRAGKLGAVNVSLPKVPWH